MNNPFIVSSSPLALYQKAVALKKEKKKNDTRLYVGRHLMGGPLMQIIHNNKFSHSAIKHYMTLLPIFLPSYIFLFSVSLYKCKK